MTTTSEPAAGPVDASRSPAAPAAPAAPSATERRLTVNGERRSVVGEHPHLLSALREELDILSPKDGCSPSGQCGCCTVLLDGKPVVACQVTLDRAEGADITTLEGLPAEERARYAGAFAATGALQCGFCTPGILIAAQALLDSGQPTRDEIVDMLSGHLCRCTGYAPIVEAIAEVAQA
jgi:aldehyde oxidoreductase